MIKSADQDTSQDLPTINRSAMVLEPTEVYLQWAKESPEGEPELTRDELREECTVYLIPELAVDPETWLKRYYAEMFEDELAIWCEDETHWPKDRSFESFKRFFRVQFHSLVVDMGGGKIVRDDE